MFTRGTRFWHTAIWENVGTCGGITWNNSISIYSHGPWIHSPSVYKIIWMCPVFLRGTSVPHSWTGWPRHHDTVLKPMVLGNPHFKKPLIYGKAMGKIWMIWNNSMFWREYMFQVFFNEWFQEGTWDKWEHNLRGVVPFCGVIPILFLVIRLVWRHKEAEYRWWWWWSSWN